VYCWVAVVMVGAVCVIGCGGAVGAVCDGQCGGVGQCGVCKSVQWCRSVWHQIT
jgi:hypothetical protein